MNTDDLRSLLDERAGESVGGPTSDSRIAGIRGKAGAIRTRRIAGVGGAVAAVAVVVVSGLLPFDVNAVGPEPATTWTDLELPKYSHGGVKIGEARLDLPNESTTVNVTPEAFPLILVTECDTSMRVEITAKDADTGEHLVNGSPCGGHFESIAVMDEPMQGDEPAIGLGAPVTYRVTIDGAYDAEAVDDRMSGNPEHGAVALGIYESVPWDEYQFPSPSRDLLDLDEVMGDGPQDGMVVRSADDPNQPVTVQFTGDGFSLNFRSQTPGQMKILINGEEVGTAEFWDYGGSYQYVTPWGGGRKGLLPEEGVEITFVPRDFTGAWRGNLQRCELHDDGSFGCGP